jgi:hypothetical protein
MGGILVTVPGRCPRQELCIVVIWRGSIVVINRLAHRSDCNENWRITTRFATSRDHVCHLVALCLSAVRLGSTSRQVLGKIPSERVTADCGTTRVSKGGGCGSHPAAVVTVTPGLTNCQQQRPAADRDKRPPPHGDILTSSQNRISPASCGG